MVEWDGLARRSESAEAEKPLGVDIIIKGFIYVLKCKDQKLYIGSTRDLDKRLKAHNAGRVKTTKNRRPFELVFMEEFENYCDARKRELYLKSGTGRDWLKTNMERCQSG